MGKIYCSECGTELDDSSEFCSKCGNPINSNEKDNVRKTNGTNMNNPTNDLVSNILNLNHSIIKDNHMIKKIPFKKEYYLHNITQKNLKELFDLEFVASEIQLNDLRFDNLAFDEKTNSFVIIEYKNELNQNVLSQGKDYYDLLLNNKEIYIKRYNEEFNPISQKMILTLTRPEY